MSRRQVHNQKQSKAMDHGQQAIWTEIRRLGIFTITDVWGVVDMHRKSIINYVKRLEAGGYVEQRDDFETSYRYQLVKNTGATAPRLTKEGMPVTQGGANENMWRSMRMMDFFTPNDLIAHSNTDTTTVALTTAKAYCTALTKAGYLRVVQKARPPHHQAIYKLVRNTGPRPPQVQKIKQVFDPNLNKVTYHPDLVKPLGTAT